jgi:serine/threonine-protein kinase
MSPSLTLLNLIGRALLEGMHERPVLVRAVWRAWSGVRDELARQAELLAVAETPIEDLRRSLGQAVLTLTADRPAEDRAPLASALVEVARRLRKAPAAPAKADDLLSFLPEALPELPADLGAVGGPAIDLRVTAGPHAGRVFRFTGHDTFLVGRSRQAHFDLGSDDRYFSRAHFMIEANPPQARLVDMGSRNGTFLDGKRVVFPTTLAEGDRIQAGHTTLAVSFPGALAQMALPEAPPVPSLPATGLWSPETAEPAPLPRAQVVPGYRTVRELGRGGMGVVYLAHREPDGAVFALKTITPTLAGAPAQVERFLREARVLEALDHPHIVPFRAMGEAGGLLYFAMDYVAGTDTGALLRKHGPLPVGRAVRLITPILQALDYAHAKGFVHRDVKPANILVVARDGEDHPYLADFGLARVYQSSQLSGLTVTGSVGGTPAFMAPEQVTSYREVQPAADQYSAAATLYNLLTGAFTHDFSTSVHERLMQLLHEDPTPIRERRPGVPDTLADAVHRALAREPSRRFPDARAFRRALLAAVR